MNHQKQIANDKDFDLIMEFDFYNYDRGYFYKHHGKVVHRFSKILSEWILELDRVGIDMKHSKDKADLSTEEVQDLIKSFYLN